MFIEDAEPSKIVDMFNWITISGLMAVFFVPIAGVMVRSLSLVTAMRYIYGWLTGWLSEMNRALLFVLNAVLYVACIIVLLKSEPLTDAYAP